MEKLIVHKKLEKKSLIFIFTVREFFIILSAGGVLFLVANLLVGLYALSFTMLLYLLSATLLKIAYPSLKQKIITVLNPYIPSACYEGGVFKPKKQ